MERITIRHEGGNTLTGTVEQVLSTHLAPGWRLVGAATGGSCGYETAHNRDRAYIGQGGYGGQDR